MSWFETSDDNCALSTQGIARRARSLKKRRVSLSLWVEETPLKTEICMNMCEYVRTSRICPNMYEFVKNMYARHAVAVKNEQPRFR
jgi:3-polyprenyl-4-hydroxybenzoate decarboxylase